MSAQNCYIGVEVEDTLIKSALTDSRGEILEIEQRNTPRDGGDQLQDAIATLVLDLRRKAADRGGHVLAVGVGVPGAVNQQTGRINSPTDFPVFKEIDWPSSLPAGTGLPVVLDHSAKLAAYGEFICGAAQGLPNVLYIDLGPTIGAGIIHSGTLYRGSLGLAGEFGHMTVNPDGLECVCGNVGCLETIASGPNLVRRTQERLFHDRSSSLSSLALPGRGELSPERIAMEALNGDDFALMMLERTGRWVGVAVANVINLLNLDMVILAGSVMVAGDLVLRPVILEVQRRALEAPRKHCRIVTSVLGGQAGLIGAAMLARDTREGHTQS
jgi:glucokinase